MLRKHRLKHKMHPNLGCISRKICSFVGSIHPVEKVGASTIRVQMESNLNGTGMSIQIKKLMKKPVFLRKQAFRKSFGGDKRDRTADLLNAIQALSQAIRSKRQTSLHLAYHTISVR